MCNFAVHVWNTERGERMNKENQVSGTDAWKRDHSVGKLMLWGLLFAVLGVGLGLILAKFVVGCPV
jgi:hypothetical protein